MSDKNKCSWPADQAQAVHPLAAALGSDAKRIVCGGTVRSPVTSDLGGIGGGEFPMTWSGAPFSSMYLWVGW